MMIARLLFFLLVCTSMTATLHAGLWETVTNYFKQSSVATPPMIKVLIVHDQPGVILEVKGKYKIFDPYAKEHIGTRFVGKRKFIQALQDGLKWGEEFPGVHQIMIVPDNQSVTTLVDGIEYRGVIAVYDVGGSISVVNETYIEDYLSSVLSLQFRDPLPDELLAAIAITARTNAYYQTENPKSKFWDVDARQVGYHGYAMTHRANAMEQAILATRFMVMSQSPSNSKQVVAFPVQWGALTVGNNDQGAMVSSRLSFSEAEEMAKKGDHAAQILTKAFPGTAIHLIYYAPESAKGALK
jgi:stage II sporulation protein D